MYRPQFLSPEAIERSNDMVRSALADGVGKTFLGIAGTASVPSATAFAYVRVSSPDQVGPDRTGLPRELMRIDTYATQAHLVIPLDHIYGDDFTGREEVRPSIDRLLRALEQVPKNERVVVIEGVDRLGRNYGVQWTLTREIQRRGGSLRFLKEMSDLEQMAWAMAAQVEVQKISERRIFRNRVKMLNDELIQFHPRYGYKMAIGSSGRRTFEIDEPKAAVVREIFERYVQTGTLYKVIEELQRRAVPAPRGGRLWALTTVRDILRDDTYIGIHTQHRIRMETTGGYTANGRERTRTIVLPEGDWQRLPVPAIVARPLFAQAVSLLATKGRGGPKTQHGILRGRLRCGNCGRAMVASLGNGGPWYHCPRRSRSQITRNGKAYCSQMNVKIAQLDELVWSTIADVILDAARFLELLGGQRVEGERRRILALLRRRVVDTERAYLNAQDALVHYYGRRRDNRYARTDVPEDLIAVLGKLGRKYDRALSEHASWMAQPEVPTLDEMLTMLAPFDRDAATTEARGRVVLRLLDEVTLSADGNLVVLEGSLPWDAQSRVLQPEAGTPFVWRLRLPFVRRSQTWLARRTRGELDASTSISVRASARDRA